jgi:hypothetical protein
MSVLEKERRKKKKKEKEKKKKKTRATCVIRERKIEEQSPLNLGFRECLAF